LTLAISTKLGPYEIIGPLGAGGMGEVYRARDTRLDRDVAIKVLPDALAREKERVLRFEREAKLLAALNHPKIGQVYGFEDEGDKRFLVLEYVEGQTLAERLKPGAIPVEEALEIGRQVAEALEAAHEKGIIHRDLKPGNVMVRPDGVVKVLDFGLARATLDESASSTAAAANSPTVTVQSPAITGQYTRPGVVLGTAAYMSPEQARGRPLDKRTDIWSFGVILYECLTATSLFHGETVTDSLGAILHKEPDWSLLPPGTPPTVQLLLRRCLAKDRRRRVQDIGDARVELEEAIADPKSSALGLAASAVRDADARRRRSSGRMVVTVAAVLLAGLLGLEAGRRLAPTELPQVRKYEIPLVEQGTWNAGQPAVSPDGSMVAFVDLDRVWIRRLDSFDARAVEDSEHGVIPFWSPDSRWLGFGRGNELVKVSASGGRPVVITEASGDFSLVGGAAWSRDNRVFFSTGDTGILEVSADGGVPRIYVPCDLPDDDDFHELALLPDGRSVVFSVHSRSRAWYLAASNGTQRKMVLAFDNYHLSAPAYSPTGHILFSRFANEQAVWAVPFSVERLEATGDPFPVTSGDGDPSVSDTGVLALTKRIIGYQGGVLVRVDIASGEVAPFFSPGGVYYDPALSPDGTTLALAGFDLNATDIWLLGIQQGTRTRLTFDDSTNEILPQWSPDGGQIAFAKTTGSTFERIGPDDSIHFVATDGSGETRGPIPGGYPAFDRQWTHVAFVRTNAETGRDIYYQTLDGAGEARPIVQGPAFDEHPALSPDGRWLAYTSNESGVQQVYLKRFPSAQGKWQVSTEHGVFPVWSPDGTRLYFVGPQVSLFAVEIITEPRVMLGNPELVVRGPELGIDPYVGFTFTNDGQRLVVVQSGKGSGAPAIGVIENWFEEFKDRS